MNKNDFVRSLPEGRLLFLCIAELLRKISEKTKKGLEKGGKVVYNGFKW